MNLLWNTLGWVAAILNVWGNLALTTKGIRGWIIRIACNLCWMPYGIYTRAWALLANHLLFVAINAYGWWKWRRDELRLTARIEVPGETPWMDEVERARREGYVRGWDAAMAQKPALTVPFICDEFRDTNIDGASETRTFVMHAEYEPDHVKRRWSAGHLDVSLRRALGAYPLRAGRRYRIDFREVP